MSGPAWLDVDDDVLRTLGRAPRLALWMELADEPRELSALSRAFALAEEELAAHLSEMLQASILTRLPDGRYAPARWHLRSDPDAPSDIRYCLAALDVARRAVAGGERGVRDWGPRARVGVGRVTLPQTPETVRAAADILARAESELRALRERVPAAAAGEPRLRVDLLLATRPREPD